jgi:hypothetical protein
MLLGNNPFANSRTLPSVIGFWAVGEDFFPDSGIFLLGNSFFANSSGLGCWEPQFPVVVAGDGPGVGRRKAPRAAVDWRSAAWPATGLVPAAEKLHARPSMEKRGVAGDGPGAGRRKAARAAVDGL